MIPNYRQPLRSKLAYRRRVVLCRDPLFHVITVAYNSPDNITTKKTGNRCCVLWQSVTDESTKEDTRPTRKAALIIHSSGVGIAWRTWIKVCNLCKPVDEYPEGRSGLHPFIFIVLMEPSVLLQGHSRGLFHKRVNRVNTYIDCSINMNGKPLVPLLTNRFPFWYLYP